MLNGLSAVPEICRSAVLESLTQWQSNLPNQLPEIVQHSLVKVWTSSEFIALNCLKDIHLLPDLIESGDLLTAYHENSYKTHLNHFNITTEAELMTVLRKFRRREMIRIAWRDLAGWSKLTGTLHELSWLADSCIQYALDFLYAQACSKKGTPLLSNSNPQQIIVLGMGKLGAYELNYSSDIDLIFAYPEEGVLSDKKQTTYGEFFTKLCQSLVKVLDDITVDGFVFRTDIRLRPFGDSGAVIMTFDGMEHYYLTQAREWERYAMIKARQVAGDFETGAQLMAMLNKFVYRRYLDYGAFEELRSLKAQINQELLRKDRVDNVKLGAGGIREIEFIGQAFQLIRGGSEKRLQIRGIMDVLKLLGELNLLTPEDSDQLQNSYRFLRRVENHIQQYQDKQTHDLPNSEKVQAILAYSLDYSDWNSFKTDLEIVRKQVHSVFDAVFSVSKQEEINQLGQKIWANSTPSIKLQTHLKTYGFNQVEETLNQLEQFKNANAIKRLSSKGMGIINRLMPQLIEAMKLVDNADKTLKRILKLFESVAGRTVYLALLSENPKALEQLVKLCSQSIWICDYLSKYPILFDELLDTRSLYEPLNKENLTHDIQRVLNSIDVHDLEQLMIALRQFKQLNVLRTAAADIMDVIPIMVVSDYLTYIAEVIIEQVLYHAWNMIVEKHGIPQNTSNTHDNSKPFGFAILGFGKFGGIELGYGSDLDLVFLYDCIDGNSLTNGTKPISTTQFYIRLGQKIRHILDTQLLSGILYEVDMRLRPNGDSGLLVSHIKTYHHYLLNEAWTWEHQALVRGRFIAGDEHLKHSYDLIRKEVLSLNRDIEQLKTEVREMRLKMRDALAPKEITVFDLKHSQGGIADIEFMVQFGVLARSPFNSDLTIYTDNVRLIEGLQKDNFFSEKTASILKDAYCYYRDKGHKLVLQGSKAVVSPHEVELFAHQVITFWKHLME